MSFTSYERFYTANKHTIRVSYMNTTLLTSYKLVHDDQSDDGIIDVHADNHHSDGYSIVIQEHEEQQYTETFKLKGLVFISTFKEHYNIINSVN